MTAPRLEQLSESQAEAVAERLGLPDPATLKRIPFLGKGGFASVYWLPDRKTVFKLTTDKADAQASSLLIGKKPKHIVYTYDAFQIDPKHYGIVNEKLTPLGSSQAQKWRDLANIYFEDVTEIDIPLLSHQGLTPQWVMAFKDAVFSSSYAEQGETLEDEFDEMLMFALDLQKYHIIWRDWHHGNIMNRGRTPVISDLGGGTKSPPVSIPKLV